MNTNFEPTTHDEKLSAVGLQSTVRFWEPTPTREVEGTIFELRYRFNAPPVDHGRWTAEDWVKYIDSSGVWEWRVQG